MQAPKPTTYRGIRFRSRLESYWAVFLDHHPMISAWVYEPFKLQIDITKWEWTPDFAYIFGGTEYLLEVKPEEPSEQYLEFIGAMLPLAYPRFSHLQIGVGSFYRYKIAPTLNELWVSGKQPNLEYEYHQADHGLLLHFSTLQTVFNYRFDLAGIDQPITNACKEYQKKLQTWAKRKK